MIKKILLLYFQSYSHFLKHNFVQSALTFLFFFTISISSFAQGPGSLFVNAGADVTINCGQNPCTDLTATFLETFETLSNNYTVTSIPYNPPFPFNGLANSLNPDIDDAWSPVDNLPFDFCFFGNVETEFQVGSNGVIRFDVDPLDIGPISNAWSFDSDIPNNIEEALAEANVFLPGHDIDPTASSSEEIGYEVLGTYPNRVLVVSYYEVPMFSSSCNNLLATQMVVFYEFSNVIEIYIQDKPVCTNWNDGNATMGIQNNDGTIAFVPPGRNTSNSPWTTNNEAWSFSPAGAPTFEFAWLDSGGNVIGTDPTITVCPTNGFTTYTARVTYTNCNGDVVVLTDDVEVTLNTAGNITVDLGPDIAFCDTPSYEIVPEITGDTTGATYLWSPGGQTTPTITVSTSDTYSLEITKDGCVISDSVNLLFLSSPNCTIEPICEGVDFEENFGTGIGRVSTPFTTYIFNEFTQLEGGEYAITNISTGLNTGWHVGMEDHTPDDVDGRMIFVNASDDPTDAEFYRRTISVQADTEYTLAFWLTTVYDPDTFICPGTGDPSNVTYRIEDAGGILLAEMSTGDIQNQSDPNWQEYSLVFNSNTNTEVQLVLINNIFGTCGNDFAMDDITISFQNEQPQIVTPPDLSVCDIDNDGQEIFNLEDQIPTILNGQDPALFNTTFHLTQFDAEANQNAIVDPAAYTNTSNPETIYVRVEKAAEPTCFNTVSFQLILNEIFDLSGNLPTEVILCLGDDFPPLDATPTNPNIDLTLVTFEWTDSGGTIVSTDAIFTPTASGTYTVTVTYPPCSEQTFSVNVIVNDPPVLDLGPDQILCDGSSFEIIPQITGGSGTFTYLWSTGETTPSITVSESGTYSLEITDGPCTVTDSIEIIISDPVVVDLGEDFESCFNQETVLTAQVSGNPAGATYEWYLNGILLSGETNQTLFISQEGEYTVIVTVDSCVGEDSIVVSLREDLEVSVNEDFVTCPNEPHIITATTTEEGVSYQWFLNGNPIAGETNSTLEISLEPGLLGAQTYSIEISLGSCTATDSVEVSLYAVGNCIISEGISPNGDGYNDSLDLTFLHDRSGNVKIQIFNRLGTVVFEKNNYTDEWYGQTTDGNDLPTGTYFYVIDLTGYNASPLENGAAIDKQETGWIYLNQKAN